MFNEFERPKFNHRPSANEASGISPLDELLASQTSAPSTGEAGGFMSSQSQLKKRGQEVTGL